MNFAEKRTGLYIISGDKSSGKSALMNNYALSMSRNKHNVLYFSCFSEVKDTDGIIAYNTKSYEELLTAVDIALRHRKYTIFVDSIDLLYKEVADITELYRLCKDNNVDLVVSIGLHKGKGPERALSTSQIPYLADQIISLEGIQFNGFDNCIINGKYVKDRYCAGKEIKEVIAREDFRNLYKGEK